MQKRVYIFVAKKDWASNDRENILKVVQANTPLIMQDQDVVFKEYDLKKNTEMLTDILITARDDNFDALFVLSEDRDLLPAICFIKNRLRKKAVQIFEY